MYYAVIFTSTRTEVEEGYAEMATKMVELAKAQPGYIGMESARSEIGITDIVTGKQIGRAHV